AGQAQAGGLPPGRVAQERDDVAEPGLGVVLPAHGVEAHPALEAQQPRPALAQRQHPADLPAAGLHALPQQQEAEEQQAARDDDGERAVGEAPGVVEGDAH
ncbi:MAG: hypothetical protein ACK559_28240, partial [bacterium]